MAPWRHVAPSRGRALRDAAAARASPTPGRASERRPQQQPQQPQQASLLSPAPEEPPAVAGAGNHALAGSGESTVTPCAIALPSPRAAPPSGDRFRGLSSTGRQRISASASGWAVVAGVGPALVAEMWIGVAASAKASLKAPAEAALAALATLVLRGHGRAGKARRLVLRRCFARVESVGPPGTPSGRRLRRRPA